MHKIIFNCTNEHELTQKNPLCSQLPVVSSVCKYSFKNRQKLFFCKVLIESVDLILFIDTPSAHTKVLVKIQKLTLYLLANIYDLNRGQEFKNLSE